MLVSTNMHGHAAYAIVQLYRPARSHPMCHSHCQPLHHVQTMVLTKEFEEARSPLLVCMSACYCYYSRSYFAVLPLSTLSSSGSK